MPFITRLIHEKCPGWEYTVIKINNGIFDCAPDRPGPGRDTGAGHRDIIGPGSCLTIMSLFKLPPSLTSSVFVSVCLQFSHPAGQLTQILFALLRKYFTKINFHYLMIIKILTLKLLLILGEFILADPITGLFGAELVLDIFNLLKINK